MIVIPNTYRLITKKMNYNDRKSIFKDDESYPKIESIHDERYVEWNAVQNKDMSWNVYDENNICQIYGMKWEYLIQNCTPVRDLRLNEILK